MVAVPTLRTVAIRGASARLERGDDLVETRNLSLRVNEALLQPIFRSHYLPPPCFTKEIRGWPSCLRTTPSLYDFSRIIGMFF